MGTPAYRCLIVPTICLLVRTPECTVIILYCITTQACLLVKLMVHGLPFITQTHDYLS